MDVERDDFGADSIGDIVARVGNIDINALSAGIDNRSDYLDGLGVMVSKPPGFGERMTVHTGYAYVGGMDFFVLSSIIKCMRSNFGDQHF